ncbi:phenylacetate--CoA ligase family protein [Flaviramulus aquimarinus]|uniref:Phenylacetate--CoA ligase family protein n=1 Tax=Flaviramulus aquimarinus TaxID=1170456 RepID=A0ABP9EVH3_9FLAO
MLIFFEKLRYYGFWIVDFIKGSPIRKNYNDIKDIVEDGSGLKVKSTQALYLRNLIKYAVVNTDFYKNYDVNEAVENLPVLDKNILRDECKRFQSKAMKNKKTFSVVTSGSTGTPFEVFQDANKKKRNTADVIYFSELANFKLGYKLIFLRKWSEELVKPLLISKAQNIMPLEVMELNDGEYIKNFISTIRRDASTKSWIGYASAYEVISKYLDSVNHEPIHNANIKSIIGVAESLTDYTKERMNYYFSAPVFSRYSNMENGILAQQTVTSGNDFIINTASYYIEVLKMESDEPADKKELGRIVITDLFNYAMPLIRYDTGDLGVIDSSDYPQKLTTVQGRKTDAIFNTKGEVVSTMIIACVDRYQGIIQGQLIQETKFDYKLKLNITDEFNSEIDIIKEYKKYLGEDANIIIEYVDEIPRLNSGKRRATINNYIKTSQYENQTK